MAGTDHCIVLNASTLASSAANSVPAICHGRGDLGFGARLQSGAWVCMNPCTAAWRMHLADARQGVTKKQARQLLDSCTSRSVQPASVQRPEIAHVLPVALLLVFLPSET